MLMETRWYIYVHKFQIMLLQQYKTLHYRIVMNSIILFWYGKYASIVVMIIIDLTSDSPSRAFQLLSVLSAVRGSEIHFSLI